MNLSAHFSYLAAATDELQVTWKFSQREWLNNNISDFMVPGDVSLPDDTALYFLFDIMGFRINVL